MTMTLQTVFRKGVEFEFPPEVMERCGLRPNQRISGKRFWQALVCHAEILILEEAALDLLEATLSSFEAA
jgi:hypothetical protein